MKIPTLRKIVLVGHCGPDASYLRLAVSSADRQAKILAADDEESLQQLLTSGVDLLLLNRVLDSGFAEQLGVDLIRRLRAKNPQMKMMLVSNYSDAQADAVVAGALPGFGKHDIGSPRVGEVLRSALRGNAE